MVRHVISVLSSLTLIFFLIAACNSEHNYVQLISPADGSSGENTITARLVWKADCDSADVYLGLVKEGHNPTKIGTTPHKIYQTSRLDFNTSYRWFVTGYKNGKKLRPSPEAIFTTRDRSGVPGLSNEYGIICNGVGYFQDANGTDVKAVDLDSYEELWTYKFEDMYDVSPMVEKTKDGTWLIIEHERANSRVRALYLSDGTEAWVSDNNIPYIGGTGFNYYICKNGDKLILAKGSNGLHALSIEDGGTIWFNPAQSWFGTIPAVDQINRWIYSQSFEEIRKIDAETGKALKTFYTRPEAMTSHSNTLLVNDEHGYFIATSNWNGNVFDGDISVYDSSLNLVWKKSRFVERLSALSYHDGLLYSAQCAGWYKHQVDKMNNNYWKRITAFKISDGTIAWDCDLSKYRYSNIHEPVYCNGFVYAVTDNTGLTPESNRFLFRIDAENGQLTEVFDFGYPLSICASPVISAGKFFEAGKATIIGKGEHVDWSGQYGIMQLNHNAANDQAVTSHIPMSLIEFTKQ